MFCVPFPPVIVPVVIVQAYPENPPGPLAVLPVEPAQTELEPGVTVGVAGSALTVTLVVLGAEVHPFCVTVTE